MNKSLLIITLTIILFVVGCTKGGDQEIVNGSVYTVHPEMNFIIKTSQENYYKLHFIDFFNTGGVKGYPKWEYQLL